MTSEMQIRYLHNNITIRTGAEPKVGVEADIFHERKMNVPASHSEFRLRFTMTFFVAQTCCFWNLSELDRFLS